MIMTKKTPEEQRAISRKVMSALFTPGGEWIFRTFFSSRAQMNAMITPIFFQWLVGKSETNLPEEGGYGVKIEKCRFLEESGCKGLCVNMCKIPVR